MTSKLKGLNLILKKFLDIIKSNKKIQLLIIVACSISLVFLTFSDCKKDNVSNSNNSVIDSYVFELEEKLTKTLSKVNGVGKVSVIITVDSGLETILASKVTITETSNGVEKTETPLVVNGKTVVVKEKFPEIVGVLIVAQGAKNISVLTQIQKATVSLLDVNVNQIEILEMK